MLSLVSSTIASRKIPEDKSSFIFDLSKILAPAASGPITWQGDELNPTEYVIKLDERDILDIRAAVISFKLNHVINATKMQILEDCKGIGLAGSKVTSAIDFHSDRFSGDVIALYVRNDSGSSTRGEQFITSFPKIYDELLKRDPKVLETIVKPDWPFKLKKK
ncbi:unnamed protein product [Alternaria alternata]